MIITRDFVFLNNPRTGSTFARKAIRAAYGAGERELCADLPVRELLLPVRRGRGRRGSDHHGTYAQIPTEQRWLPVVSAVRNPFTLLVSAYELGLWVQQGGRTEPAAELPPFEVFLDRQCARSVQRWGLPKPRPGLGPLSLHHLQMFAKSPRAVFAAVRAGAAFDDIDLQLGDVVLLRQEGLRSELWSFLRSNCAGANADAVLSHPPSHVTRRSRPWAPESFPLTLIDRIHRDEAFLFASLAQRGIRYDFANADFRQDTPGPRGELTPADGGS